MWQSSRLEETVLCAELDRARRDLAGVAKLEAGLERPGLLGGDGPAPRWHRLDLKAQVRARAARSAGTPGPLLGDEFRAGLAAASSAPAAPLGGAGRAQGTRLEETGPPGRRRASASLAPAGSQSAGEGQGGA